MGEKEGKEHEDWQIITGIDRAHNLLSRAQAIYSILHKATLDLT